MRRISVLGPVAATSNGSPLDIGGPTQRKLLASLVAARGEVVSIPVLLESLWGDEPPPTAPATIQSYVSRLRKVLDASTIVTEAPGYRIDSSAIEIDAEEFLALGASLEDSPEERAAGIAEALNLWKGPAFEDFAHLEIESRSLTDRKLALEEQNAEALRQLQRYDESLAASDRVISAEPLRERAWLERALTLGAVGRQPEAIQTLNDYRDRLADLGLEPTRALSEVEDLVFEQPPAKTRPLLPIPPDEFIGRESEVEETRSAVINHRVVTVIGPGGMGKTRLSLEVLRSLDDEHIWVVALGSVSEESGVLPAILNSIGIEARGDLLGTLAQNLGSTQGTLFLDNCEHVIDEVARVVTDVTKSTPIRVLATSREALNVAGEAVFSLGPMNSDNAVRLFVERADRVGAEVDTSDVADLVAILDYMPLAIEMAASRSTAISVPEITRHLNETMKVLDRTRRGDTPRHHSLEAMVQWSYALLTETEQLVFKRLSVFAGPFGLKAATEVVCFDGVAPSELPGHIAALVDRSLIVKRQAGGYRLLRVLRAFASNELGDDAGPPAHHARFFAGLAGRIGEGLAGPEELSWIGVALDATEDMSAAIRYAVTSQELDIAVEILEGLFDWFYHRQPPALMDWGDMVLSAAGDHPVVPLAAAWSSLAAMKRGDVELAMQQAEFGISSSDGPEARYPLFMAGDVACYTGDLDLALDMFDKQLVRASSIGDEVGVIDAVAGEALALAYQGMYERALAVAEGIEQTARRTGSPTYMAYADYTLGEALAGSDHNRAIALFERAVATSKTVNNQFIEGMALTAQGWSHLMAEEHGEALRSLQAGLNVYCAIGAASYTWTAIRYLALLAAKTGDAEAATVLMSAAEAAGRRPYGSDEVEWLAIVEKVSTESDYRDWVARGSSLQLHEAANLAASIH